MRSNTMQGGKTPFYESRKSAKSFLMFENEPTDMQLRYAGQENPGNFGCLGNCMIQKDFFKNLRCSTNPRGDWHEWCN